MTNNTTNPCLPAAPRRGKSSILHSAYCTVRHSALCILHSALKRHSAFLVAAVAAMTVGIASAAPQITGIYTDHGTHAYGVNDVIAIKVRFNGENNVTYTGGTPSLTLGGIQPGGSAEAMAVDVGVDEEEYPIMIFNYTVKPGDFSSGLAVTQFKNNGATIKVDSVNLTSYTLPAGDNLAGETITIRTITFADGTTTMDAGQRATGSTLDVEITCGATTTAQNFDISVTPNNQAGKISIPAFSIQNSDSGICSLGLSNATDGGITVTFHPRNYTGTDGDLTLTLTVTDADKPHIVAVHNDGDDKTYTVGGSIDISVEMNDVIDSVSGSPYLKLDIQNQDTAEKKATFVEYDDKYMYFTYTVQSGDFAKDLDLTSFGFVLNNADIEVNGQTLARTGYRAIPVGNVTNSLSWNADINIITITLDDYTLARSLEDSEGKRLSVEITRREASAKAQGFTITASANNKADFPANFSIPRNEESAMLDIDLVEATENGSPLELRIHPNGYSSNDGDIVLSITINPGTKPPVIITGPTQMEEGSGIQELTVSLSRPPRETTTVNISCDSAANLAIVSATSLTFGPGDTTTRSVTVQPLDGDKQVTVTAAAQNEQAYSPGTLSIFVANKNPNLVSPPAEGWEPAKGGEGFAYTVGWSGRDVDADNPTLYAIIHWGDGNTTDPITGASGSVSHVYNVPGSFGITVELHDKDGGVATASGTVEIEPAVTIVINEHKAKLTPPDVGQNGYNGLQGLGRGTVDDRLTETTRLKITDEIDWQIKYSPATATATLVAEPETFTYPGVDYEGVAGDYEFDSFFHVWLGDEDTFRSQWCRVPLTAPSTAAIRLRDGEDSQDRQVGGVFSREHYPDDNYADIDWDRLPDVWENEFLTALAAGEEGGNADETFRPFETRGGDYGEDGNPDNDFLPACVASVLAATTANGAAGDFIFADGEGANHFEPYGLPFVNLYEVRGTHPGLNARDSVPADPQDEPHMGAYDDDGTFHENDSRVFFGTDPTKADTDCDRLTDGYEYFFWRWAHLSQDSVGEHYDPTKVITGYPIDNAIVESHFNPCVANNHLTLDTDGDGLSNFEEFLLGTNPINWDTDGDTMNDGWEVMWGLNPFSAKDAEDNPDGDYMAYDGLGHMHYDVYNYYGFDPRTAWNGTYLERNRKLSLPAPNTKSFDNIDEYYLARWLIDKSYFENAYYMVLPEIRALAEGQGLEPGTAEFNQFIEDFYADTYDKYLTWLGEQDGIEFQDDGAEGRNGNYYDGFSEYYVQAFAWTYSCIQTGTPGDESEYDVFRGEFEAGSSPLSVQFLEGGLEVGPLSEAMTQPVPYGTRRYYLPSWKGTPNHVPDHAVAAAETHELRATEENDIAKPYTVPYGNLTFLVDSVEITTHGCDTDGDRMPDGWELYIASGGAIAPDGTIWPFDNKLAHARFDNDFDTLSNLNECHSTELCDYYGSICTNGAFANVNGKWYNKWWPCDPWNGDTDGDHVGDGEEGDVTFMYQTRNFTHYPEGAGFTTVESQLSQVFGANTMLRGHVPGGGLNPNSVDTDMDYLPDAWEYQYAGFNRDTDWEGGFCNQVGRLNSIDRTGVASLYGGGMDGTYFDSRNAVDEFLRDEHVTITNQVNYVDKNGNILRNFDFDGDGLENYQEYLVNAMGHVQYDKWAYSTYMENGGESPKYGAYDPNAFFVTVGEFASGGSDYPYYNFKAPGFGYTKHLGRYYEPRVKAWIELHPGFQTYDWAAYCEDWQNSKQETPTYNFVGLPVYPFAYMPSEVRPWGAMVPPSYASSDPRLPDTDADNMDDYYEMFHGLNPVLSDVVDAVNQNVGLYQEILGDPTATAIPADPMSYDFNVYPWLAGVPNADPDQDGIPNWEEALSPNQPAPANHNTDPSPLWFTDLSNTNSLVNVFYGWGSAWNFWAPETFTDGDPYQYHPSVSMMNDALMDSMELPSGVRIDMVSEMRPSYIFSFEMNEGFDTDNDNLSDRYEVHGVSGGVTDAQSPDRPGGRKALYLDGASAARTRGIYAFGLNALRSWTLEAWVMPENPASGKMQVVIERPVRWDEADTTPTDEMIRRTFRLGLDETGHPFVEFNNGDKDKITERAVAPEDGALEAGRWYHLAATMDGFQKKLALYVDGRRVASTATKAIPYTGFTVSAGNGIGADYHAPQWAPIVIGASDSRPDGYVEEAFDVMPGSDETVTLRYHNGFQIPMQTQSSLVRPGEFTPQPGLGDFFQGWVDEVRIWSGARPGGEDAGDQRVAFWGWPTIKDDYDNLKRYGMDEVRAERDDEVKYLNRVVDWRKYMLVNAAAAANAGLVGSDVPDAAALSNAVAAADNPQTWFYDARGQTFEEFFERAVSYILMTGGEDAKCRIPPNLICVYNFDSLPDPSEGVMPARFADLNGRPEEYEGIPWLANNRNATTVYRSSQDPSHIFPQYVQNLVAWQPLGHLTAVGVDEEYNQIREGVNMPLFKYRADHVADSKYWTRDTQGGLAVSEVFYEDAFNDFPNNANPYGNRYETANFVADQKHPQTQLLETFDPVSGVLYNDLVPLLGARSDTSLQLWDDPYGDNVGVNKDADGDGLPDWWEYENGMDPHNDDQNGNGVRDDMDDFDGDGLTNWYEFLALTDPFDTTTDGLQDDADADIDGDGLSNIHEQEFATHPLRPDSDDDGWNDGYEVAYGSDPLDSLEPFRQRALMVGADDFAYATAQRYLVDGSFTLAASVNPYAYPDSGYADIVSYEIKDNVWNYYIRIDPAGIVTAGFTKRDGSGEFSITAPAFRALPIKAWTRVSLSYDYAAHLATLLLDDEPVASLPINARPAVYSTHFLEPVVIGGGFHGMIRNVLLSVPGEDSPRMDIRFDDGTAWNPDDGVDTYGVPMGTDIGGQAEDFAPATTNVPYGSVAYRMLPETAATLSPGARFVLLDENLAPVDEGYDLDGDGLPDEWEIDHGLNPFNPDSDGDGETDDLEDDDLDGLNNYFEYLAGTDPHDAKTDGSTFDGDADIDGDGLTNIQEQHYGSNPSDPDTDDDGIADGDEVAGCAANGNKFSLPTSALSPARQGVLKPNGGNARFEMESDLLALRLEKSWTIEAWVKPDSATAAGEIISRGGGDTRGINYELSLSGGRPRARILGVYEGAQDSDLEVTVQAEKPIPANEWTHLAAVWNNETRVLALYVDGVLAGSVYERRMDLGVFAQYGLLPVRFGNLFHGAIDEVRIWDIARSGASIGATAFKTFEHSSSAPIVELRFDDLGQTVYNFGSLSNGSRESSATMTGAAAMAEDETSPIAADEFVDSDGDHIPDFWEIAIFGSVMACDPAGDEDDDGLSNLYEYYSCTFPLTKYTGDESYGSNVGVASPLATDATRDTDGDGLTNLQEQNLDTRPDLADTDDDGWTDYEEVNGVSTSGAKVGVSDPLNPLSPAIPRAAQFTGAGTITVPQRDGKSLAEWTVAAWIRPDAGQTGEGTVVGRFFPDGSANYEIGVRMNGDVLEPFARYSGEGVDGTPTDIAVSSAEGATTIRDNNLDWLTLKVGAWTHIAASYTCTNAIHTVTNGLFTLYVDGTPVAWRQDALPKPWTGAGAGTPLNGKLVIGEGYKGLVDDVRVAAFKASDDDIVSLMGGSPILAAPVASATNEMAASAMAMPEAIGGEYIVRFRDGITKTASAATVTALGGSIRRAYNIINAAHVVVPQGTDENAFVAGLKADPTVLYVEPNRKRLVFKAPNDSDYSKLWAMKNNGQTGGTAGCDIDAETAWEYTTGSSEIVVAVIDTGVDYNHPDLANNMWTNSGEIPDNGVDDDGNGLIDDVYGYDFANNDADPTDDHGHGTHCAGTIGGVGNNGQGVAGVNWSVKIMALKASTAEGSLPSSAIIASIDYAVQMGARVSNNSYGGYGFSQAEYDAVKAAGEAGMVFVAAAGNEANDNDVMPAYPASFDLDCVIAVAATDSKDALAVFSNYGATTVDLGAPGVGIWSAAPTTLVPAGYQYMDGTSMATPHVTGAAALILAADPTLTVAKVKELLLEYADPIDALNGKCVSGGRLNIGAIIPEIWNPGGGDKPVIEGTRALTAHYRFDDAGTTIHDFATAFNAFGRVNQRAGIIKSVTIAANDAADTLELGRFFGDVDGDDLPDWWEDMVGFSTTDATDGDGRNGDPDGDGLTNFNEFLASLGLFRAGARGLDPFNPDTDNDGIADYDEDSDGDGLTNGEEQDTYLSHPGDADTDDDTTDDADDNLDDFAATDSSKPYVNRAVNFAGGSDIANTVVVKDKVDGQFTERFSSDSWTVECWINPAADALSGAYPLVARRIFATGAANYELGISGGKPYVLFQSYNGGDQVRVAAGSAIASSTWTHLAATLDAGDEDAGESGLLTLLVNGEPVASADTRLHPATGPGDLVFGSANFKGQMFDVRIWKTAQPTDSVKGMMRSELLGGEIPGISAYLSVNGDGHLQETAVTTKANGDPIDLLTENWTIECWVRTTSTQGNIVGRRNVSDKTNERFNYCIQIASDGSLIGRFTEWYDYITTDDNGVISILRGYDYDCNNLVCEQRINDGKWHHVAYVRGPKQVMLYVDGIRISAQDRLRPTPVELEHEVVGYGLWAQPGPVVIGEGMAGDIDEVRIWNRDLTPAEIRDVSSRNLSGEESGLITYFNFDFQQGTLADERAAVRNPGEEYGVYINGATLNAKGDGPAIANSPLRSIQNLALSGAFYGRDGGKTVEDLAHPCGSAPFGGWKYAGVRGSSVSFATQSPLSWTSTTDSDGDGMPDVWEVTNGLNPYNSDQNGNGIPDGFDDFDQDGLRNEAEYRAGLDPWNPDSAGNGTMDFYDKPASSDALKLSYGWLYTDVDYVFDNYELGWE
ncbi:MAG: S8 family serine peptidase, partial [Kiritimatiellae bacterium]|nr:S8 family serine peptidase [Kiritimatiellia bacterium]